MDKTVINSWEEMLGTDDVEYVDVPIGTNGAVARLATLNAEEMTKWLEDQQDAEKSKINGFVLVAKCLVNEDGKRIGKIEDVMQLRNKQPKTCKRLVAAALQLNELKAKAAVKNDSSEVQPDASLTD